MMCQERTRLLEQYKEATKKLDELSREVWDLVGPYEIDAYQNAWHRWKGAWVKCRELLSELNEHMSNHRCA